MSIPDVDHVIRYCRRRDVFRETRLPMPGAFEPSDSVPRELSVNWCERMREANCEDAVDVLRDTPAAMKPENRGCYAILNVDDVKKVISGVTGVLPEVVHTPKPGNESHSDVRWHPADDEQIKVDLATLAAQGKLLPGLRDDPWRHDGSTTG